MQVLRPLGALAASLLLSLLLLPSEAQNNSEPQVWLDPPNPLILSGSSIVLNCSTDCKEPLVIGLETVIKAENKIEEAGGKHWKAFRLKDVTQDNSPFCYVNCLRKNQGIARANITVYEAPKHLELKLNPFPEQSSLPWIPVGQDFFLNCHMAGGRPRQNLVVKLLRGDKEISRQSAPDSPNVKFQVKASREDNEANFSCSAELDLQSRGLELYQSSSAPQKFHTFDLAREPPELVAPKSQEKGTELQVRCEMDKVFPVEKAHMQLSWKGQRLTQVSISKLGDALRATATFLVPEEEEVGVRELTCSVNLGNEIRKKSKNVTVYTFQAPNLTVSEPIQEGCPLNLTCKAHPPATVEIEGFQSDEPDMLSRIAQEKDNGRLIICRATLEILGEKLNKTQSLILNVQFPPKLENCSESYTWKEGTDQILECTARGNPKAIVKCIPENQQNGMPYGKIHRVVREYNGTYLCTASNLLGEVNRTVSVVVTFQDMDPWPAVIGILVSMVVVGFLMTMGYLYYRQQRIRRYELKKAQEAAKGMKLITPNTNTCP